MKRGVALSYARVSGPNDERTASLESQEEAVVARLASLGYEVPAEFRFRERWSGLESIYERQVLIRCRQLVAQGEVQAFGVYDTDRLCRDPDQLILVCGDNALHDVETIFVKLDHETRSRIGRAILYIKGLSSALEADAIKDRTNRGRMKRYLAGIHAGYGRCRYGYRRDRDTGVRSVDPATGPIMIRIFRDTAAGTPPTRLCSILTTEGIPTPSGLPVWTASTIRHLVRERTYYGHYVGRRTMSTGIKRANGTVRQIPRPEEERIVLENHGFPPLIERETWEKANAALGRIARGPRPPLGKNAPSFLLSGMLYCGCGFRMTQEFALQRSGRRIRRYRCTGGIPSKANANGCRITRGAAKLEDLVWYEIAAYTQDPTVKERIQAALENPETDAIEATIRRDLASAEARQKKIRLDARKLVDAQLEANTNSLLAGAIRDKMADLDAEATRLDAAIADLRGRLATYADRQAMIEQLALRFEQASRFIREDMTVSDKQQLLRGLGVTVTMNRDHIKISIDERFDGGNPRSIPKNTLRLATSAAVSIELS